MIQISGQTTVATSGKPVPLGAQKVSAPLMVKAKPGNTGNVYVGNDGANTVSSTTGVILAKGDAIVFQTVTDLAQIYVDAATGGDGVAWLILAF